jgi:hypothetical protein
MNMRTDENCEVKEAEGTYRTSDFTAICSLQYFGFSLEGFERDVRSPGKVAVYFKRSDELDAALQSLWSKELKVEPLAFLEVTRAVKARLRDCA